MTDLLFAVPWWIPTVIAVIGILIWMNGNRRQIPRQLKIGGAILGFAIAWALLSYFVDTDKEKVEHNLRRVVQDAVDGRWPQFQAALSPAAEFSVLDNPRARDAEQVTLTCRTVCETVHLRSAHLQTLQVDQSGPYITVHCDILSMQELPIPTEVSSWQFEWEQTNSGWRLKQIRLMALKDVPTDQIRQSVPGLR